MDHQKSIMVGSGGGGWLCISRRCWGRLKFEMNSSLIHSCYLRFLSCWKRREEEEFWWVFVRAQPLYQVRVSSNFFIKKLGGISDFRHYFFFLGSIFSRGTFLDHFFYFFGSFLLFRFDRIWFSDDFFVSFQFFGAFYYYPNLPTSTVGT